MPKDLGKNLTYLIESEKKGLRGVLLEGSSRSRKTWGGIDNIVRICAQQDNQVINIIRETYHSFKTTLYDDFNRRLPQFGISSPFSDKQEVASFKLFTSKVNLLGSDRSFEGVGCDYFFMNEMLDLKQSVFDQSEQRCRKFWWGDYNPKVSEHWAFNKILLRSDVGFLKTTFIDNPFISSGEKNKILSYEPWMPGSYIITESDVFYNDKPISKLNQPPIHPINVKQGTSDEYMWRVYGLGLRMAPTGLIFNNVDWVDSFPEGIHYDYGMDFGFTTDPTVITKNAETKTDIWIECLSYEPMETPDIIFEYMKSKGIDYRKPITADSADKYTGENKGTVEMVKALKSKNVNISKVNKTQSVMFWLMSMKSKRIHIVRNEFYAQMKKEQENYKLREINGMAINQPIDSYNHIWDSARYRHMAFNKPNNGTSKIREFGT